MMMELKMSDRWDISSVYILISCHGSTPFYSYFLCVSSQKLAGVHQQRRKIPVGPSEVQKRRMSEAQYNEAILFQSYAPV